VLPFLADQGHEIGAAVAVQVVNRDVDRTRPAVDRLGLEAGTFPARRRVSQQEDLARLVVSKFGHDQVEIAVGVEVRRPHIGHPPQAVGEDDFFPRTVTWPAPQPDHAASIVIAGAKTAQVGHHEIGPLIAVEIARFHVAGVAEPRENLGLRLGRSQVGRRDIAESHVAQQQQRVGLGIQPGPAQLGQFGHDVGGFVQGQSLHVECNRQFRFGFHGRGKHDLFRSTRPEVGDGLMDGRWIEIVAPGAGVELVAPLHLAVPPLAGKILGHRQGVTIAAKGHDARFRLVVQGGVRRVVISRVETVAHVCLSRENSPRHKTDCRTDREADHPSSRACPAVGGRVAHGCPCLRRNLDLRRTKTIVVPRPRSASAFPAAGRPLTRRVTLKMTQG